MRYQITDRYYRTLTYQPVDRLPDLEFGFWPQTLRRWAAEGMPVTLTEEDRATMFPATVDRFFGFESIGHRVDLKIHMNPAFAEEVLERRGEVTVMRDREGVVAERYREDAEGSSIPRYLQFPVTDRAGWLDMKRRFRAEDPTRCITDDEVVQAQDAVSRGRMIWVYFNGFYNTLRGWMGMESLSLAFYDEPALVREMVEHWADLCTAQLDRLPSDLPVDYVIWWEDMAGRNGPLISPATFRAFLQPGYRRVMDAVHARGCVLSHVDCDGDPHDIVANWLEEGVNVMFPLEVQAGVDPYAWRREFGKDLKLRGGIAKTAVAKGPAAIDEELERVRPLVDQGGYIPHLDHLVPPDVPYTHYLYYLERKRKLIGR